MTGAVDREADSLAQLRLPGFLPVGGVKVELAEHFDAAGQLGRGGLLSWDECVGGDGVGGQELCGPFRDDGA